MAKTVDDLLIKLGVVGLGSVNALKSALRKLGQASASSDKELIELKKDILEVARSGKLSRQAIIGQVDALKALRNQAVVGGEAFKQLSKDVAEYEARLKTVDAQIDSTGKKIATLRQIETRFTGKDIEGVEKQIAQRRELLDTLKPLTAEYAKQLGGVKALEQGASRALARQQVVASAQMQATVRFARGGDVTGGPGTFASTLTEELGPLPQTINALNLEISELKTELKDLDFTSDDYSDTQARILELEEKLKQATDTRTQSVIDQERRLKKLDETEERRARRAAKVAGIQAALSGKSGDTLEIGSRDPRTGAIIAEGTAPLKPYVPPQVREISGLYRSISDIGMSGISADIDRMGKSYQEVARDIEQATFASNGSINSLQAQRASWASLRAGLDPTSKAYQDVGREIEKVDRRLEKLNKRRRRPTFAGAASMLGGIAAGGVFGGPEGAIGGAVGGAVGGVAGVAAGAALGAQVKMLREALGATSEYAAGLQKLQIALKGVAGSNYPAALQAATKVTQDFNVPQEVAIKSMTRLSAAVVGAGGNVADAEVVFRNITSAIKATGGGAQDVDSAITAMVQTFSKGKVSAEELSGQLGERLPGAVTKFAEANDMTLPQLQKAFKAGTVGLDELMKFIISLGPEYAKTAAKIADSSADAGARAQVAFNEVRIAVGEALQPVGAQMQEAFAEFITDIAPALISAAKAAATGLNLILDVAAFLVKNFEQIASAALVLGSAVGAAGLAKAATLAGSAMNALKLALFDVKLAVAGLGKALAFLAANPIVLLVAGVTAASVALYRAATANDRFVKSIDDGKTTLEEANEKAQDMNDEINTLQKRLNKASNKRLIQSLKKQLRSAYKDVEDLNNAIERSIYREFGGGKDFVGPVLPGSSILDEQTYNASNFPDADGDGGGSGSARVMMTQAELDLRNKIREARRNENKFLESSLTYELDILLANQETEDALARTNAIQQAGLDFILRGRDARREAAEEAEREANAEAKRKDKIQQARILAGEITQEEYDRAKILKEMEVLLKDMPELLEKIKKKLSEVETPMKKFRDGLKKVFEEAINLKDALAVRGVQAVQQFGDAFADFVATGKSSFKELTVSILQDLSRIFARAALFKSLSLIPGVGNFLGLTAANGAVVSSSARNGIVPYAKGGIVNKPTLFQYANGGSGRFGLMGEAGPEAIMPLRRGRNGKLGVESSGSIGNVVVNVDASGSSAQGDQPNAKALGQAIGAAVQAELIKQKRPGGLLS